MLTTTRYILLVALFLFAGVRSIAQKAAAAPASYDDSILYGGCWFVPHNAGINIKFSAHYNFEFNDYDTEAGREITLTGKYLLDGHSLWLIYNDRPKQKFYFYKGDPPDNNYYFKAYPLKTSPYYFVHGNCE
ncbi:MAG: hypothetical protein V4649_01370 [Bacteroidota bacterium]